MYRNGFIVEFLFLGVAGVELVEEGFDVFFGMIGKTDQLETLLEGAGFVGNAAVDEEVGEPSEVGTADHDGWHVVCEDEWAINHGHGSVPKRRNVLIGSFIGLSAGKL